MCFFYCPPPPTFWPASAVPPKYADAVPWCSKMTASKGLPAATITEEASATRHFPYVMSSKKSF